MLRYSTLGTGGQCVMITGVRSMLTSSVRSWALHERSALLAMPRLEEAVE